MTTPTMTEFSKNKCYEDLVRKQQKFIDIWIMGGKDCDGETIDPGDRVGAYIGAGYSDNPKHRARNARALFYLLHHIIVAEIENRCTGGVPKAMKKLDHLLDHAKSETVQFNVARDILDRAGMGAKYKQEAETETPNMITDADLQ